MIQSQCILTSTLIKISLIKNWHVQLYCTSISLQPNFKMISRYTIDKDIMKLYDIEKLRLEEVSHQSNSWVAITIDMWTCNKRKGYMSIIAHFIDEDCVLQSRILRYIFYRIFFN